MPTDLKPLSTTQKRIYETQEHFLRMYTRCGTILGAAKATGISRPTVYAWQREDTLGFASRFQLAKEEYRESLEALARSRLLDPQGERRLGLTAYCHAQCQVAGEVQKA